MADRHYTITIKNDTSSSSSSSSIAGDKKANSIKDAILNNKDLSTKAAIGIAYAAVKSVATTVASHEISLIQLRKGSNEQQQRANFIYQQINKGVGILEATAAGAMVGGVYGAAFAFVSSLATTLVSTGIEYAKNADRIQTERNLENASLQMNYIRAGAKGSRGNA